MSGTVAAHREYLHLCQELVEQSQFLEAAVAAGDWEGVGAHLDKRGAAMLGIGRLGVNPGLLPAGAREQALGLLVKVAQCDLAAIAALELAMSDLTGAIGDLYQLRDTLRRYLLAVRPAPSEPRFLDCRQ